MIAVAVLALAAGIALAIWALVALLILDGRTRRRSTARES